MPGSAITRPESLGAGVGVGGDTLAFPTTHVEFWAGVQGISSVHSTNMAGYSWETLRFCSRFKGLVHVRMRSRRYQVTLNCEDYINLYVDYEAQ